MQPLPLPQPSETASGDGVALTHWSCNARALAESISSASKVRESREVDALSREHFERNREARRCSSSSSSSRSRLTVRIAAAAGLWHRRRFQVAARVGRPLARCCSPAISLLCRRYQAAVRVACPPARYYCPATSRPLALVLRALLGLEVRLHPCRIVCYGAEAQALLAVASLWTQQHSRCPQHPPRRRLPQLAPWSRFPLLPPRR
jgi:hypothetical protein